MAMMQSVANKPTDSKNITTIHTDRLTNISDLPKAESHFNWFPQDQALLGSQHQRNLLSKLEGWIHDLVDVEVTPLTIVSQRFLRFTFESFVHEDVEKEKRAENEVASVIEDFKGSFHPDQYEMFKYLHLTDKAVSCYLLGQHGAQQEEYMSLAKGYFAEMSASYGAFILTDRAKAIALGLKGHLMGHIGKNQARLECFREAVRLDPESSDLRQYLYSSLRRVRREREWGSAPSEEELLACVKGYELLEFKTSSVLFRMATMCEDLLALPHIPPVAKILMNDLTTDQLKKTLLWFVEKAVKINPKSISAQCKYGDILAHGPTRNDDVCEKHFNACLEQWPNHSQVLHKAGKFYAINKGDIAYGLQLLQRGLESDSDNFPCLMEYLRCLAKQNGRNWELILQIINEYIEHFKNRPFYKRRLLHAKGTLLWSIERKCVDAVECWIKAFETDATTESRNLLGDMSGISVFKLRIDFNRVLSTLEELKTANPDRAEIIDKLSQAINKQLGSPDQKLASLQHGRTFGINNRGNTRFNNNNVEHEHKREGKPPPFADRDSDWRRKNSVSEAFGSLSLSEPTAVEEQINQRWKRLNRNEDHQQSRPHYNQPYQGQGYNYNANRRRFGDMEYPKDFVEGEDQVDKGQHKVRGRGSVCYNPDNQEEEETPGLSGEVPRSSSYNKNQSGGRYNSGKTYYYSANPKYQNQCYDPERQSYSQGGQGGQSGAGAAKDGDGKQDLFHYNKVRENKRNNDPDSWKHDKFDELYNNGHKGTK